MELNDRLEKFNSITDKWNEHISKQIAEKLKTVVKRVDNDNIEIVEIGDIGSIDSIEDGIIKCEILDGSMIEIPKEQFVYEVEEGDIINLKLTYKERKLKKIDILDKNNEEKLYRIQMMKEKMSKIRSKE